MPMKMPPFFTWSILLITLVGCGKDGPRPLSSDEKKIVSAYVDLLILQETHPPSDPAYQDSCLAILSRHGLTPSECERIIARINERPERWEVFYQNVLSEIDRRRPQHP